MLLPPAARQNAPVTTLVDRLLAEQAATTTAVEAFARWHDRQSAMGWEADAVRTEAFRGLIPLSRPGRGEQYAFEVNLSQCTGCKACVAACHSLNGLDDDESWRDVGTVTAPPTAGAAGPVAQTITTACHHCDDPACANGCPVLAYEKDPVTGIVRHLDDQCIGCSYCILKCPYDVPKFNSRRGIVRKCDMCHQRLQADESPACVQACPTEAITIRIVARGLVPAAGERLVPGAFPSDYTRPTTRFVSGSLGLGGEGVDAWPAAGVVVREDPGHPPLSAMLVLTQMAAGAWVAASVAGGGPSERPLLAAAALAGVAGVGASTLHLGQPLKAWRIFLGWRKSWLSREAMVLGAFAAVAVAAAAQPWIGRLPVADAWLPAAAAALGLAGVAASAMVYVDTRRPFWSAGLVSGKFAGTTVLLGSSLAAAVWAWQGSPWMAAATTAWVARVALSAWESAVWRRARLDPTSPWHASALVLERHQGGWNRIRNGLFLLTVLGLPAAALAAPAFVPIVLTIVLLFHTASQWIERHQFFTAAAAPRMPGLS